MTNILKDQEIEEQRFKLLLMHICPIAYREDDQEKTISTEFLAEIEDSIGRPLTDEEKAAILAGEDIDFIG